MPPAPLAVGARGTVGRLRTKSTGSRDVTFREDASQVEIGSRLRVMATLRNLVIGLIRQVSYPKIAATIRKIRNDPHLLLSILGPQPNLKNTP
jgi:hypothetical protein